MQRLFFAGLLAACLLAAPPAASADDKPAAFTSGAIRVIAPWTRATPKGAAVASGYLSVTNSGKESERLLGGASTASRRFELHAMATIDGVMTMRELTEGLEIKPGETVEFKPGGLHIMFTGLAAPVKEGDRIKATLMFERAGAVEIEFTAAGIGAAAPAGGHEHAH